MLKKSRRHLQRRLHFFDHGAQRRRWGYDAEIEKPGVKATLLKLFPEA